MPNFFSDTFAVLKREIRRIFRQPMYWTLTVFLPLAAFSFFAILLSKGVSRDIPVAVVDQDQTSLSRKVVQMIDATPTARVAFGAQSMEEAERLIRDPEQKIRLTVPQKVFERASVKTISEETGEKR